MAGRVEALHLTVVSPLVRHVEGAQYRAAVWIEPVSENLLIQVPIEIVDRIVEGDHHQLWYVGRLQSARNLTATTLTVRQLTPLLPASVAASPLAVHGLFFPFSQFYPPLRTGLCYWSG